MTTSTLPSYVEIQQWDDEKLKNVHWLIFDYNTYPGLEGEDKEDVEEYMTNVHAEYEHRQLK